MTEHTTPIACALNASDLEERGRWFARLARHVLSSEDSPDARIVRFGADPEVLASVNALADAEARCCPFLTLEVAVELRIAGPEEARPIVAAMFAD